MGYRTRRFSTKRSLPIGIFLWREKLYERQRENHLRNSLKTYLLEKNKNDITIVLLKNRNMEASLNLFV